MIGSITGVLASRNYAYQYFTSTLYPFAVDDGLSISLPLGQPSVLWENPNDDVSINTVTIISGTLAETIIYKTYNDGAIEDLTVSQPAIISGTLVETIIYKTYNEPLATEPLGIDQPIIISGTLVETIVYVSYNNGAIEDLTVSQPIIVSGTLV